MNLYYKTSVGDNIERMALVLGQSLQRSDLIIITGGLGPTVDDVTREAVARATDRELVLYPDCLAQIEAIFARCEPGDQMLDWHSTHSIYVFAARQDSWSYVRWFDGAVGDGKCSYEKPDAD